MPKKVILILSDWFLPGYRAGGPIRSCANFAYGLSKEYDIHVLTTDTDFGNEQAYPNIIVNEWSIIEEKFKVYYLSKNKLTYKNINGIIKKLNPDYCYLNSMFSIYFTIFPLFLKWRNKIQSKIVLAPRGMLKISALQFKKKKSCFFFSFLGNLEFIKTYYSMLRMSKKQKTFLNEFILPLRYLQYLIYLK